jgi:hypothetical protein
VTVPIAVAASRMPRAISSATRRLSWAAAGAAAAMMLNPAPITRMVRMFILLAQATRA